MAPTGDGTRPTSDKTREAVFDVLTSVLGADLGGGLVLDIFAGSGAMGLEALSRGCAGALFVENDPAALAALRHNIAALEASATARVLASDAFGPAWLRAAGGARARLLFADPPYRIEPARVTSVLAATATSGLLEEGAVIVFEHASDVSVTWPSTFTQIRERRYGSTGVSVAVNDEGA